MIRRYWLIAFLFLQLTNNEAAAQLLSNIEIINSLKLSDQYIEKGQSYKALVELHRVLQTKEAVEDQTLLSHLYNNLAIILARYNNFAAAMSCFHKAGNIASTYNYNKRGKRFTSLYSFDITYSKNKNDAIVNDEILELMVQDQINQKELERTEEFESERVEASSIVEAFLDKKEATHYAMAILIKQPIPGQKNTNTGLGEVGHSFISLIKYNKDQSAISKTFGFYPEEGQLIPVNPLSQVANSVIKDDAFHAWDQLLAKFVTKEQFEEILEYIDHHIIDQYHLSDYNCSDFALFIAKIGKIQIDETVGTWPLGKGDNPGYIGQSILAGKYMNVEVKSKEGLFTCSNNLFSKTKK
jgi:tetratricopeptide (TPR) repeat protein